MYVVIDLKNHTTFGPFASYVEAKEWASVCMEHDYEIKLREE